MKTTFRIVLLTLAVSAALPAFAAVADRSYYVTELANQQKFDVFNDGHNTYLESVPGLVVTGATADGERYIVNGVPQQIRGFMNGKPITVVRGMAPLAKPAAPDPAVVNAQIKQLSEKLDALTAKVPAKPAAAQGAASGAVGNGQHVLAQADVVAGGLTAGAGATLPAGPRPSTGPRRTGPSIADVYTYRVGPNDENLRVLVERWSKVVGWKAIWDLDKDIPIGSQGEKSGDWKTAVRWVLSSSKFGDVAVKPCFYNNSVVRVVRETVKCNPNE